MDGRKEQDKREERGSGGEIEPPSGTAEEVDERVMEHSKREHELVEEIESVLAEGLPLVNRLDSRTWVPAIQLTYHIMARRWLLFSRMVGIAL